MKTLTIVRHGKSSWDYPDIKDFDRPLKIRGINNAYEMAERLKKDHFSTDLILSSPAARAITTASIFSNMLELNDEKFRINTELYMADTEEIMNIIYTLDGNVHSCMIFGHNPGFTDLANHLSTLAISNIPTAGLVILKFDSDQWNKIDRTNCNYEYFDYPKNK